VRPSGPPPPLVYPGGMRTRVLLSVAALIAASAWCCVLLVVRKVEFGEVAYAGLVWNLVLAWIPLGLASLLLVSYSRRRSGFELSCLGIAWLLFLPNAPYVLTDFVHLEQSHRLYDSLIIASFAFTSLALGFASLLLVQLVVTRLAGALFGWLTVVGSLFLASLGIYLGRVQRVNSWDVVHRPGRLWELARIRIDHPFGNPHLIGYVILLGGFLTFAYAGLYGLSTLVGSQRQWPSR
jgi:uncharacterized membrane protein